MKSRTVITLLIGVLIGILVSSAAAELGRISAYLAVSPNMAKTSEHTTREGAYKYSALDIFLSKFRYQDRSGVDRTADEQDSEDNLPKHCAQYSGARQAKCVVEFRENGVIYQPAQTQNRYK